MGLVIQNIFWLTASRAIALVLLFLAYTQLFRYLGPFGNGQYQFVLSYVLIFSTVVDFGIQQFITKKMTEAPDKTREYFESFFKFELVASGILFGLLIMIAYLRAFEPVVIKAVVITGLGMVANALCYPYLAVLTAKQDLKKVALINLLNSLVNVTVIFLAIWLKKYIVFLATIQLIFGVLDLGLYRWFVSGYLKHSVTLPETSKEFRVTNHRQIIWDILKSGWPFALLVGFSAIYNRIDVVIISSLLGFAQTGIYTSAYKFFDLLNFFPASVSHALFPALTGFMAQGRITEVKLTLEKYLRLMLTLALPMAVGGTILSKSLILLVAGEQFLDASRVLSVLIWAIAILFIYIPLNALVISQLTKSAMVITGLNVLINIVGNIVFLPIFGIVAAAGMTVVSEFIQGGFYFYLVKKKIINFAFLPFLWKPLLATGIMGLVMWQFRLMNGLFLFSLGIVIYGIMSIFLNFREIKNFKFLF